MADNERHEKRAAAQPRRRIAPKATRKPKQTGAVRAAKQAKRSHLEVRWIREWERLGGPPLVEEFQFHPTRRWRADFAHLASKTLIEIEGGGGKGRHTRAKGFAADLDKYLTAHLHGWRVVRIGTHQVRSHIVAAVIGSLVAGDSAVSQGPAAEDSAESWEEDAGTCLTCGSECVLVRPGKSECPVCEGDPADSQAEGEGEGESFAAFAAGMARMDSELRAGEPPPCGEGCGCAVGECARLQGHGQGESAPDWLRGRAA